MTKRYTEKYRKFKDMSILVAVWSWFRKEIT